MIIAKRLTHSSVLRSFIAYGWTIALLVTLLQSSQQPVMGPAAPPGNPDMRRELLLTVGHIIGFGGLTLVWWWLLDVFLPLRRALILAVTIALSLGVLTELLQSLVPDRNASLYDMGVNALVTLLVAGVVYRWCFFAEE